MMSSSDDAADVVANTSNSTLRQTISDPQALHSGVSLLKPESSAGGYSVNYVRQMCSQLHRTQTTQQLFPLSLV